MFYVCLVDDNAIISLEYKRMIEEIANSEKIKVQIDSFSSGEEFLTYMQADPKVDLLYLDITMKGLSGLDTAKQLEAMGKEIKIVFLTGNEDYAFQSIGVNYIGYILKNDTSKEQFKEQFMSYYKRYNEVKKITVLVRDKMDKQHELKLKEIVYIELNNSCIVKTMDMKYQLEMEYDQIKEVVLKHHFVEVHHILINLAYIYRVYDDHVEMNDGSQFHLKKKEIKEVKIKFAHYLTEAHL